MKNCIFFVVVVASFLFFFSDSAIAQQRLTMKQKAQRDMEVLSGSYKAPVIASQRPRTPRDVAIARMQQQNVALTPQQMFQQQALQRQISWQVTVARTQQHQLWQDPGIAYGNSFPKNGAAVYNTSGPIFPKFGAYCYGNGPSLGSVPRNSAYVYQGGGNGFPKNGAFAYQGR